MKNQFLRLLAPALLTFIFALPFANALEMTRMFRFRAETNIIIRPNTTALVFQRGQIKQMVKAGEESSLKFDEELSACVFNIAKAEDFYQEITSGTRFVVSEVTVDGNKTTMKIENKKVQSIECYLPNSSPDAGKAIPVFAVRSAMGFHLRPSPMEF